MNCNHSLKGENKKFAVTVGIVAIQCDKCNDYVWCDAGKVEEISLRE